MGQVAYSYFFINIICIDFYLIHIMDYIFLCGMDTLVVQVYA